MPVQPPSEQPHAATGGTSVPGATGLQLLPFRAVRYALDGAALAAVTSPPYDVIDDDERDGLAARDPHNVVRLILPTDVDAPGDRYAHAAATLRRWLDDGLLRQDAEPALYVYEEQVGGHVQRGIVGGIGLARPEEKVVLPHEDTMAGPVADRLALLEATATDLEPIVLAYDGGGATSRTVAEADMLPLLADLITADGVHHRLWAVTDPAVHEAVAADLAPRRATIADGHHRYATYLQYQAAKHAAGAGPGPWDAGLAFLVDTVAFGPQVHAIHRVVGGMDLDTAVARAAGAFTVTATDSVDPARLLDELAVAGKQEHAFVVADGSRAFVLSAPDAAAVQRAIPTDRSPAWRELDVTLAHYLLVRELWGLTDREDVVGYRHDAPAALLAAKESGGVALLLNPTPVSAVAAVAAAGERMPRKSTLFTPKPRTGLLLRPAVENGGGEAA